MATRRGVPNGRAVKSTTITYNGRHFILGTKGYYESTYKHDRRKLHQVVWEDHNGPIPSGFDVHHKNEIKADNRIENLECITKTEHHRDRHAAKLARAIAAAPAWHASPAGIEWHRQNAIANGLGNRPMVRRKCDQCGTEYETKGVTVRFCSNACKTKSRMLSGIDDVIAKCVICGIEYTHNKYQKKSTCTKKCAAAWRRQGGKHGADGKSIRAQNQ